MIKFVAASAVAFVVWFFALGSLVLVLNTIGGAVAMRLLGLEGETIGDMPEALRTMFALFALAGATLLERWLRKSAQGYKWNRCLNGA